MLYKYVSLSSKSFDSILKKHELYFASVKSMNDPFEGKPYFSFPSKTHIKKHLRKRGARGKNINDLVKRAAIDLIHNHAGIDKMNEEFVAQTGLLCMTPINDNLLMWAHYADSHRGVCFGFDVRLPFDPIFGFGYEVIYENLYPEISLLELDAIMANAQSSYNLAGEELERYAEKQLFTKGKCWEYEKEVRFHRPPIPYGVGSLPFNKDQLKSIIFGYNFDEGKKAEIIDIAQKKFPCVEFYQAALSKKEYRLEINRIQITKKLSRLEDISYHRF